MAVSQSASTQSHCLPVTYHPSVWGDYFLNSYHSETDNETKKLHQKLKGELRNHLMEEIHKPHSAQLLNLIDAIQRLGVAYHYTIEIDRALQQIHHIHDEDDDLYGVSLRFRLLRQHGYNISCEVFNKFKDIDGNLSIKDVRSALSLYEATQYRMHGEDILDEGHRFTSSYLKSIMIQSDPMIMGQVKHALKHPIRRNTNRLEARYYISNYQTESHRHNDLLLFAKLDFNIIQKLHQKEIGDITRWWKDLDLARKLPFARDRIVECYFWALGVYFEPQYSLARNMLTKVIAMISYTDDIYDLYGTHEELMQLTEAIERWDMKALEILPGYLKIFYQALLNVYNEMNQMMDMENKSYSVFYCIEQKKNVARAYMEEYEWMCKNHVPKMEEYMKVAYVSSTYPLIATASLVGMGDMVTEDTFTWIKKNPKILEGSTINSRLMDDVASHEFEQKRRHVASSVECYIKEFGVSEQVALEEIYKQVEDKWKDINEECIQPSTVLVPVLERIENLACIGDVMYKDGDGYTHADTVTKDLVASLLVDSVLI